MSLLTRTALVAGFVTLLASCGTEAPANTEWKPDILGMWTLDRDASLEASRANTEGEATAEVRASSIASFEKDMKQLSSSTVEIRDDGRLTLTFNRDGKDPQLDNKSYSVESIQDKRVTLKVGRRLQAFDFQSEHVMRGTSGRGNVLVQIWRRSP